MLNRDDVLKLLIESWANDQSENDLDFERVFRYNLKERFNAMTDLSYTVEGDLYIILLEYSGNRYIRFTYTKTEILSYFD